MKVYHLFVTCLVLGTTSQLFAANTPIIVTGFNADEIMENNASHYATSTDGHPDPTGTDWFESGLSGHSDGLPASGSFISSGLGTLFTFQPYGSNGVASNNALRLFDGGSGTLTFSTPIPLASLSILAFTASGTANDTALPLTINFTDSSQVSTTYSAPDWAGGGNAISGLGRSNVSGMGFSYGSGNFGMVETIIDMTANDTKSIQSITFTGASDFTTYTTTSVMAISGTAAPEPTAGAFLICGLLMSVAYFRLRTKDNR